MTREIIVKASILDDKHLELDEALPDDLEQRLLVRVTPLDAHPDQRLSELSASYQTGTLTKNRKTVTLDVEEARMTANRFIVEQLTDRFSAGEPKLIIFPLRPLWVVPIELSYPNVGNVGDVGMLVVDSERATVVGWTPTEEIENQARQLYELHRHEIEAAFS
ncbi:MAG TPA: hypothetical protein ENN19_07655 [Chloroflexi bacterium]|nr:hypothetical protein [Chloroflexota bacterium]